MKKCISVLVLCALVAGGAFAVDKAIGGGLLFDISGNNGLKYEDYYGGYRNTSFGAYGFVDLRYLEIGLYYAYGSLTNVVKMGNNSDTSEGENLNQIGLSILGKYPIEMGKIILFPAFGFDYNWVLTEKASGGKNDVGFEKSQLGFLAGLGLDLGLTESLFLRFNGMFHLRMPMIETKYSVEKNPNLKRTWGMGPRFNVAIGKKL